MAVMRGAPYDPSAEPMPDWAVGAGTLGFTLQDRRLAEIDAGGGEPPMQPVEVASAGPVTNATIEAMRAQGQIPPPPPPQRTYYHEIDRVMAAVQSAGLPPEAGLRILQVRGFTPQMIQQRMADRSVAFGASNFEQTQREGRAAGQAKLSRTLAESYQDPNAAAAGLNLPGRPYSTQREAREIADARNDPVFILNQHLASKGKMAKKDETGQIVIVDLPGSADLNRKPMPPRVSEKLNETATQAATVRGLINSFDNAYAGDVLPAWGEVKNLYSSYMPGEDHNRGNWWRDYRNLEEITRRHEFFGSAFTPSERSAWDKTAINPGLPPETVKRYLKIRLGVMASALDRRAQESAGQYGADAVESSIGRPVPKGRLTIPQSVDEFIKYADEGPQATQPQQVPGAPTGKPSPEQLIKMFIEQQWRANGGK